MTFFIVEINELTKKNHHLVPNSNFHLSTSKSMVKTTYAACAVGSSADWASRMVVTSSVILQTPIKLTKLEKTEKWKFENYTEHERHTTRQTNPMRMTPVE